jgi:hypothetical protein
MPAPQQRTMPPAGYAIAPPALVPMTFPSIPTPPGEANQPVSSLRSPLPGILSDPDQIRQVYGKGTIIRRFWPVPTI